MSFAFILSPRTLAQEYHGMELTGHSTIFGHIKSHLATHEENKSHVKLKQEKISEQIGTTLLALKYSYFVKRNALTKVPPTNRGFASVFFVFFFNNSLKFYAKLVIERTISFRVVTYHQS